MKIFYDPRQVVDAHSYSKSPMKPRIFVEQAMTKYPECVLMPTQPVTTDQIKRVHKASYVDGVLDLREVNGFSNRLQSVAEALPYSLGSFLTAAHYALDTRETVCSPTSGFHHAHFDSGGGFCTFNGLMLAICSLWDQSQALGGILDFDHHYGDGTQNIINVGKNIPKVYHYTTGQHCFMAGEWESFKKEKLLPTILPACSSLDYVFFQAGADCHVDDPLGGWLTTDEIRDRDETILGYFANLGIPAVFNLAGGYMANYQDTIDLHLITLEISLEVAKRGNGSVGA